MVLGNGQYPAVNITQLGSFASVAFTSAIHPPGPRPGVQRADDKCQVVGKQLAVAELPLPLGLDHDAIIDDDRTTNIFGLLMSLNMLIETPAGFDYTAADCRSWMTDIGFRDTYAEPLPGPDSMVVGIK